MISELINRDIITPLYFRYKGDRRLAHLKELEKSQWLHNDLIIKQQLDKCRQLIRFAQENTLFYKKLYKEAGITYQDIHSIDDLKHLPIISKTDIQNNLDDMTATKTSDDNKYKDASGGSTGQPTVFFGDKRGLPIKFAAMLRSDSWTGWQIGEKTAYIWGADREVRRIKSFKENLVQKYIYRNQLLNAFSLSKENMVQFASTLSNYNPSIIIAYTNAAVMFSEYLLEHNIQTIRPKGIVCSAETLTDKKRKVIEKAFQCTVLNRYGSREVGLIASECETQEGLHINAENIIVDIKPLSSSDSENMGEIIVTDLNNSVMPLIRYNMGDVSRFSDKVCSCRRGLPMLETVMGRVSDFIKGADGKLIHGEYFSHIFYGMDGIKKFQIIQNKINSLDITIVSTNPIDASIKKHLFDKVYEAMGNHITINIIRADSITTPPSGKHRFVISNINRPLS